MGVRTLGRCVGRASFAKWRRGSGLADAGKNETGERVQSARLGGHARGILPDASTDGFDSGTRGLAGCRIAMKTSGLTIGIVGAGTAGPAAAVLLARAGHRVRLYERAPVNLPVGAGFLLQPTGMGVLAKIGVLDELRPLTAGIRRLHCLDRRGRSLLNLNYEEALPGVQGAGTHRATLLNLLLREATSSGVEILWDHAIASMERGTDGRPRLVDARGGRHGPFDLLLLCDGAQSTLRAQAGLSFRVDRYPWGALWFIGKRPSEFAPDTLWQRVGSTRELVGFLPTGTKDDLLSFFWSVKLADVAAWREGDLNDWKRQVLALAPQAEGFLAQIKHHDQLSVAAYHDVRMRHWHGDRVAVLGDAGHALSPQLGQGVNLALMDAAALVRTLGESRTLEEGLAAYSEARRSHLCYYQFATRWLTPFFQSDAPSLGWLRDGFFPLIGRVPWVRRQMITTMAGQKTGVFGRVRE